MKSKNVAPPRDPREGGLGQSMLDDTAAGAEE